MIFFLFLFFYLLPLMMSFFWVIFNFFKFIRKCRFKLVGCQGRVFSPSWARKRCSPYSGGVLKLFRRLHRPRLHFLGPWRPFSATIPLGLVSLRSPARSLGLEILLVLRSWLLLQAILDSLLCVSHDLFRCRDQFWIGHFRSCIPVAVVTILGIVVEFFPTIDLDVASLLYPASC